MSGDGARLLCGEIFVYSPLCPFIIIVLYSDASELVPGVIEPEENVNRFLGVIER